MKLKLSSSVLLLALSIVTTASVALAGPYSDDLAKCLVSSTTAPNRVTLVKWMFAAGAAHPAVKDISSVSQKQFEVLSKQMAELFVSLLTKSCKAQTHDAVKYEGPQTIGAGFQVLGQVAARELFSEPNVTANMEKMQQYIDKSAIEEALGKAR